MCDSGRRFNGDNKSDAVFAWGIIGNGETPQISVSLGNGDGTFQAQHNYPTPGGVGVVPGSLDATTNALLLTDVLMAMANRTLFDIASAGGTVDTTTGLYVMLNNGDGTFAPAQLIDSKPYMSYLAAKDLNGDGKTDLVVSTTGTPDRIRPVPLICISVRATAPFRLRLRSIRAPLTPRW